MTALSQEFLSLWNKYGQWLTYFFVGLGVIIIAVHLLKLLLTKDFKKKYDYINLLEIRVLWYGVLALVIGGTIYSNTLVTSTAVVWFIVRVAVSVMLGVIAGVVIQNVLKFYYPFYIEKRLKALRYEPRVSPNGVKMKLLSEEEEDVYLNEGMQAEEEVFSVDYDVWIDEASGYTKIEKYNGRLHALMCPECSYQTLKVTKEEIIQSPTLTAEGELTKHYTCTYCHTEEKKTFRVAKLKEQQSKTSTQ